MSDNVPHKHDDISDVVIVGAGLSGLVAAKRLVEHGASVRVLEAKSRVGGRLKSFDLSGGVTVDTGGAWVGPQQTALLQLLEELEIHRYDQYCSGRSLLRFRGRTRSYAGEAPAVDPFSLVDLAIAQSRLNRLAKSSHGPRSWQTPSGRALDSQTLGDWMKRNVHSRGARLILELITATSFGCRPAELSLLAFAAHVATAGGLQSLIGIAGGALQWRIAGGSASVPQRLAEQLGDRVSLNRTVRRIDQTHSDFVLIETNGGPLRARGVIVAVDPATSRAIEHVPALPILRANLERRYTLGSGRKVHIAYERPFWREIGLSGQIVSDEGLVRITFDNSPADASIGILVTFFGVAIADDTSMLEDAALGERKSKALIELSGFLGPLALSPLDYAEQDWSVEPFQSGCLPSLGPGILSLCGDSLARPCGRLHWAGSETSEIWEGHMDGAVRAGQRAAAEFIGRTRG
jgi:monoamine oxidase